MPNVGSVEEIDLFEKLSNENSGGEMSQSSFSMNNESML
jgi:hypothetical protein